MHARDHRRNLIRRILQEQDVASQDDLARILAERGVPSTQATLSRDLRDLNIVRRMGPDGRPVYRADRNSVYLEALRRVVGMEVLSVAHNGGMVVVRTLAGRAEGVAGFLDNSGQDNILGTVAGDDTVFVAPRDTSRIQQLVDDILNLQRIAETPYEDSE